MSRPSSAPHRVVETARTTPVTRQVRAKRRRPGTRQVSLLAGFLALSLALPAAAVQREFEIRFQETESSSVVGYMIHLGLSSGVYSASFDIGAPPSASSGPVAYRVNLENDVDLYVAMTSYDAAGRDSMFSNEMHVAAPEPAPDAPPGATVTPPDDPPASGGEPPGPGGEDPPSDPAPIPLGVIGLATAPTGLVSSVTTAGEFTALTLDSLAASGDVRPSRCDLDGDGDLDVVMGFGPGGDGQISLVYMEAGEVVQRETLVFGDEAYRLADGQTHPACGDIDGDVLPEIVVGLGPDAGMMLELRDDRSTGYSTMETPHSPGGRLLVTNDADLTDAMAVLHPTLGDVNGNGVMEIVVGFDAPGVADVVILEDFSDQPVARTPGAGFSTRLRAVLPVGVEGVDGTFPAAGDWDGDGLAEIAVGLRGMPTWVAMMRAPVFIDGSSAEAPTAWVSVGDPAQNDARAYALPKLGDIDGDGEVELVVGFGPTPSGELEAYDAVGETRRAAFAFAAPIRIAVTDVASGLVAAPPPSHAGDEMIAGDVDHDGIPDAEDNCVLAANPDQADSDRDGYGEVCDPDYNNDGRVTVGDALDLFLVLGTASGQDPDGRFDHDANGSTNVLDFGAFLTYYNSSFGMPGPSGLACAGTVPCTR